MLDVVGIRQLGESSSNTNGALTPCSDHAAAIKSISGASDHA